jgi:enamine deaminase RidA (YjgF/YER057c/UK114 family)
MSERRAVVPESMKALYERLHYAPAMVSGDHVFCAGQIGTGADGKLVADPEAQFTQAFENVKAVLAAAGASLDDVVELTTYHVGFRDHMGAFMRVKDRYVGEPYPAWTAIGVVELAFGALVEVKVVARRSP